uniref:BTB domain-containing protein n=1 Tax=Steinernema glaseri TaxID=37863 RepID=A0A1I8A5W2_9BILA
MNRVPIIFIEEVILQIERGAGWTGKLHETYLLSSNWGRIACSKMFAPKAGLNIEFKPNKEAVFSIISSYGEPVALEDLGEVLFEHIIIGNRIDRHIHPLTDTNLKLLQKHFRKGYPCEVSVWNKYYNQPLIKKLCLAPSRITLLKFVASEKLLSLDICILEGSPVSYETLLNGLIDALLSKESEDDFSFYTYEGYEGLCDRLKGTKRTEVLKKINAMSTAVMDAKCGATHWESTLKEHTSCTKKGSVTLTPRDSVRAVRSHHGLASIPLN